MKQVSINHAPAKIAGATTEVPGDVVLLKNRDAIVFSVCNIYFEAKRLLPWDCDPRNLEGAPASSTEAASREASA